MGAAAVDWVSAAALAPLSLWLSSGVEPVWLAVPIGADPAATLEAGAAVMAAAASSEPD
jgi:hypothetical protein